MSGPMLLWLIRLPPSTSDGACFGVPGNVLTLYVVQREISEV